MAKIHIADLKMDSYAAMSDEEGFLKELGTDEAALTYGGLAFLAVLGLVGTFGAFGHAVGADHRNRSEEPEPRGGGGRF